MKMKPVKSIATLALACLMALSLVACGTPANNPPPSGSAGPEATASADTPPAAEGGSALNIMVEVEVASLDPQIATDGTSFEVIADYTDGLMQMDTTGKAVPAIAESYDISPDGLTYTFHLREDAKWSNGDPVTADDFVFGWQRAADPATAAEYSYMLSDIGQIKNAADVLAGTKPVTDLGITAVDEKTLKVELNVPVSYFESLMYFPTFYPINRAFYESLEVGTFGTSPETVLSNGAFKLESYEPAALSFSLVKNPDYYNAANVKLDGLNYQVVKDSQQAFMSYQNGDLDIVKLSGDQVDQVSGDPELNVVGAGYMWYLTLNGHDVPALANVNLRLALTNAVNRASIVADVVKDGSVATYTAVPPQFATGPDGSDFSGDQARFSDVCADDTAKAAQYYEKAKAELGTDTFTFELLLEDQTETQNVAAVLKEQIETALPGVTLNLKVEPKKQRVEDIQNGNYEVCLTRWGPDYADPMTYLGMWVTDNNNNYGLWSSAAYDQLIADCTTGAYILDAAARWNAMYEAEKIVMDEAVIVPLYTKADANMIKGGVSGIEFHPVALNRVFKNAVKQ
ncbi:MAG TPA: peptide ABC transporter substrate-binding protein [Feifaniaceae bacterium]|nr:peptide ABC transporter substrate-binding protein [Feifaniaceae bacterium]